MTRRWKVETGEDRCFHAGNRVSIIESVQENGEDYTVTIAEVWPADRNLDICDGLLMAASPQLLAACQKVVNNWGNLHPKDLQQLKHAIAYAVGKEG